MVLKIKDPKRWMQLPLGEVITLEGEGYRPVLLEVNAETDAAFQVVYPDGTVKFLTAFKGMETISFMADGPVEVWVTSEGDVHFYTDDGRNVAFVDDGAVSFAVPHQQRGPSEQVIYMQQLMLRNMQRRNEEMAVHLAAAAERELERENSGGPTEGELPSPAGEPPVQPAPDAGTASLDGSPAA